VRATMRCPAARHSGVDLYAFSEQNWIGRNRRSTRSSICCAMLVSERNEPSTTIRLSAIGRLQASTAQSRLRSLMEETKPTKAWR
jgi:hypothetical protein